MASQSHPSCKQIQHRDTSTPRSALHNRSTMPKTLLAESIPESMPMCTSMYAQHDPGHIKRATTSRTELKRTLRKTEPCPREPGSREGVKGMWAGTDPYVPPYRLHYTTSPHTRVCCRCPIMCQAGDRPLDGKRSETPECTDVAVGGMRQPTHHKELGLK